MFLMFWYLGIICWAKISKEKKSLNPLPFWVNSQPAQPAQGKIVFGDWNKTKDWALVQTAALVINKGVVVRLTLGR